MSTVNVPVVSQPDPEPRRPVSPDSLDDKNPAKQSISDVSVDDLRPADEQPPRFSDWIFRRRVLKNRDLDAIATKRSVYDDADLATHYYPKKEYENLHRFDPNARWTYREELGIIRKIDWKVMFWAAISFSALNLDRYNIR